MEDIEIWKTISEYENYQVSNLGRIKSLGSTAGRKERILDSKPFKDKYKTVKLVKNKKIKCVTVHRLVANAFLKEEGKNYENLVVDHINSIKTDNRLVNLRFVTVSFNIAKDKKNKTSNYLGVSKHNSIDKWVSQIRINKKVKYLGLFNTEYEAHLAYENFVNSL